MRTRFAAIAGVLTALSMAAPTAASAHKLHKIRIPHPPGSTLYSLPRIPSPRPSGHLHLEFSNEFTPETIKRIETEILPFVEQEFGRPWQNVDVKLYGPSKAPSTEFNETKSTCRNESVAQDVIYIPHPESLESIAAELQHALHGCFMFKDERFEESLTVAAQTLVQQHFGLVQFPCDPVECNRLSLPESANPALAGGEEFNHDTSAPLDSVRLTLGGMAFRQYELGHPGFFARFSAAMCAETHRIQKQQGGHVHEYVTRNGTETKRVADSFYIANEIDPDFGRWFKQQAIFGPRPHGDALIIVPKQGSVEFIAVHHVGEQESAIPNLPVTLTIQGGSYSLWTTVPTGPNGFIEVEHLPTSARGYLTVTASAPGGLHDTDSYYNIYLGS